MFGEGFLEFINFVVIVEVFCFVLVFSASQIRVEGRSEWPRDTLNNAKEAVLNLREFIAYKAAHQP